MTASKKHKEAGHESGDKPVSDEAILKVAKEIVVKFIEIGRLSPGNFSETFASVYKSIRDTVRS
ncbi:MAG: hypothetical protein R3297_00160 [Desulfobulbales bacterium]|nr:hypothetical protein [Desulfobulbales bacterium]